MSGAGATQTRTVSRAVPRVARRYVLGTRVDVTSYDDAVERIANWTDAQSGRMVSACSVHPVMLAVDDPSFRGAMSVADLVTPDGMPLVWALRLLGCREATRVYGPDLTVAVCAWAADHGVPVGFYGSTPLVVERLIVNLIDRFPSLDIRYHHSPPFRALTDAERAAELSELRASGVRVLFVGLGCPKQERWMAERRDELDVVMLGVGAAFDYLAGTLPRPPAWMQRTGLEWCFRLLVEPRRLWRRYLRNNPRFVLRFGRQYLAYRLDGRG
jgi:N-acetylglucosaminyldiphosphoundecaprenol N-acetyl-beta-D-mannosaminyltransferase